jgi:hypothetical protein
MPLEKKKSLPCMGGKFVVSGVPVTLQVVCCQASHETLQSRLKHQGEEQNRVGNIMHFK